MPAAAGEAEAIALLEYPTFGIDGEHLPALKQSNFRRKVRHLQGAALCNAVIMMAQHTNAGTHNPRE